MKGVTVRRKDGRPLWIDEWLNRLLVLVKILSMSVPLLLTILTLTMWVGINLLYYFPDWLNLVWLMGDGDTL